MTVAKNRIFTCLVYIDFFSFYFSSDKTPPSTTLAPKKKFQLIRVSERLVHSLVDYLFGGCLVGRCLMAYKPML